MADNYLNKTGLQYFYNKLKNIFASKSALEALDDKVDTIIDEGGEPNTIETISVNNTGITPDVNKNVNITVPTKVSDLTNDGDGSTGSRFATEAYVTTNGGKIDKIQVNGSDQTITNKTVNITVPTKASDLTNDGDGNSPFATQAYVTQNGGKIDTISVNGTQQTITNKNVNITVPTKVSDIQNDSNFQTDTQVASAISAAVASAYKYKGSVATVGDLPASGNTAGDVYDVQSTGVNYAWTGTAWDALGSYVDTSLYWAKSEFTAITTAEIDTITAA